MDKSASLGWKLALMLPLAVGLALGLTAYWQADLRTTVRFSIGGNLFVEMSMVAQSLYMMKRAPKTGAFLLIVTSIVLGYGLHTLSRAFAAP